MKDFLLIMLLSLMACSKVTLQGLYAKKHVKSVLDGVFFNGIIFFFAALIFIRYIFTGSPVTMLFGAAFGLLTVIFQALYISAMSSGNVSMTVMIVNLGMIFPVGLSVVLYGDSLNAFKVVGILLTLLAFVISVDRNGATPKSKSWFLLALGACLTNGGLAICQKVFGHTAYKAENQSFVAWAYVVAFVLSVGIGALFRVGNLQARLNALAVGCALGAGVILGVFQWLNTYAVSVISGVVLFPTYNGMSLLMSTVSGVLLLKDRLNRRQTIAACTGIAAIILLNI